MMLRLSKKFVIMLICMLVVFGVLLVTPCVAPVTVPNNPSAAPEIDSVVVNHNPIWYSPTYTTNPYTGEVMETSSGYWRPNGTIEITIKNRPFTPYTDKNGNYINVYYSFFGRASHVGVPWDVIAMPSYVVYQSDSDYTIFVLRYDDSFSNGYDILTVGREGVSFDFRVQAVIGYFNQYDKIFEGEGSEWVEFTVTIPTSDKPGTSTPTISSKPSASSSSKPSTSNPNNSSQQKPSNTNIIIIVIFVCIITILLAVIAYQYKQRKTQRSIQARTAPIT